MGANVLVGMQILEQDEMEFIECANLLGYDYENECNNAAFKLLMRWVNFIMGFAAQLLFNVR